MFQRLYRLRRRFIYLALVLIVWVAIGIAIGDPVFEIDETDATLDNPITWIALVLACLIISVVAWLFIGVFAVEIRSAIELTAMTVLVLWGLEQVVPLANSVAWLAFLAVFVIVFRLLHGPVLDQKTLRDLPLRTRTFQVDLAPDEVWKRLVLLPENAETCFPPRTAIGREEDGRLLAIFPMRDGQMYQVERLTIEQEHRPAVFKASFAPAVRSANSHGLAGTQTVRIESEGEGSRVTLEEQREPSPLRRRLQWHLDDEFNDRCDSLIAFLEGRPDHSVFGLQVIR